MADANIKAVITAEDRASGVLKGFGTNVSKLGRVAKVAAVAGIAALTAEIGLSVKSFIKSEEVVTQLNAVLKSTGGVAGVTAKSAQDLASSLQNVTKFTDEDVLSAENLLLTFTKIGKDIFPEATKIALDMSTALGQDLKSSSIQLGKALQDPIMGVTALRRVGVNFSEAQRDVIQKLVETGQSAKAQQMIMKELNTEFGGSAVAAGQTFGGQLEILKNRFDDVQEKIGGFIAGALISLGNAFIASLPAIKSFIATIAGAATRLFSFFRPSLEAIVNTVQVNLVPALRQLINALQPGFTRVLGIAAKIIGAVLLAAIWGLINGLNVAIKVFSGIVTVISRVAGWFGNLAGAAWNAARAIGRAFSGIANAIVSPFRSAFNTIADLWNSTVGSLSFHVPSWIPKVGGKGFDVPDIPKLASGGPVTAGQPYVVGEKRPELFVPNQSGRVLPRVPSNSNPTTVNITIQAGAFMGNPNDARRYARQVARSLKDLANQSGMTSTQFLESA